MTPPVEWDFGGRNYQLQRNRQSYAASWWIQTSNSAFCQITLVLVIIIILLFVTAIIIITTVIISYYIALH